MFTTPPPPATPRLRGSPFRVFHTHDQEGGGEGAPQPDLARVVAYRPQLLAPQLSEWGRQWGL